MVNSKIIFVIYRHNFVLKFCLYINRSSRKRNSNRNSNNSSIFAGVSPQQLAPASLLGCTMFFEAHGPRKDSTPFNPNVSGDSETSGCWHPFHNPLKFKSLKSPDIARSPLGYFKISSLLQIFYFGGSSSGEREFSMRHLILCHPVLLPSFSQHQGLFQWVGSLHQVAKVLEFQS